MAKSSALVLTGLHKAHTHTFVLGVFARTFTSNITSLGGEKTKIKKKLVRCLNHIVHCCKHGH